jgi:hypothetical protein
MGETKKINSRREEVRTGIYIYICASLPGYGNLVSAYIALSKGHSAQTDMFWRTHHNKPDPKSMRVMPLCLV